MNEQIRVLHLFNNNFTGKNEKPTVLYGLGKMTEYVLKQFPNYPIIGLLDGYFVEGDFKGKSIIPLESLKGCDIRIIILARKASEKIIYNRIRNFCKEHKIDVYNLEGNLLSESKSITLQDHLYYGKNKDELLQLIKQYEYISFDIFDTLLIRRTTSAENLYILMEKQLHFSFEFAKVRLNAERVLSLYEVPNIYEIYQYIGKTMGINQIEQDELIELEINMERKFLVPRISMIDIFNQSIAEGKKVYLITDMYLPKSVLIEILHENNIKGYEDLLISCEYRTDKRRDLYKCYRNKIGLRKSLHIGDSEEADGIYAIDHDIDYYLIKSPQDLLEISSIKNLFVELDVQPIIANGFFKSLVFCDPFTLYKSNGKIPIMCPYDLGGMFLAPILLGFMKWLIKELQIQKIDTILFISRDGYLMKQIYDKLVKKPHSDYLLTSRNLCVLTSIENENDIEYASSIPFSGSVLDMLTKRFQLSEEIINKKTLTVDELVTEYKIPIIENARKLRNNYLTYLKKHIDKGKVIGIYDFFSSGTCQMSLERILDIPMKGFYFERIKDDYYGKEKLDIVDFIHSFNETKQSNRNYFYLEPLIKEVIPSLKSIDKYGNPIYCDDHMKNEQKLFYQEVQKGVLDKIDEYLNLNNNEIEEGIDIFAIHMINLLEDSYINMKNNIEVYNFDEFTNREINVRL